MKVFEIQVDGEFVGYRKFSEEGAKAARALIEESVNRRVDRQRSLYMGDCDIIHREADYIDYKEHLSRTARMDVTEIDEQDFAAHMAGED